MLVVSAEVEGVFVRLNSGENRKNAPLPLLTRSSPALLTILDLQSPILKVSPVKTKSVRMIGDCLLIAESSNSIKVFDSRFDSTLLAARRESS